MMSGQDRGGAAAHLKKLVEQEKDHRAPANLDDLIELLDADDIRNVVGMLRPKGKPGIEA